MKNGIRKNTREYKDNLNTISDPVNREIYKMCGNISFNIHGGSYCYHNTFRFIENWIYGIGTLRWGIPIFPKSKFPMFALSFYNLIPCCSICNTIIKGDDFLDHPPDLENDKILFRYRYSIKSGREPFNCENVSVEIEPDLDDRTRNTCQYFKLNEIYRHHNDVSVDIINKCIVYNSVQAKEIVKKVNKINGTNIKAEDINKIIFDEYKDSEVLDKMLGKMKKDIIVQASSDKQL